jgi:hypothetical protein
VCLKGLQGQDLDDNPWSALKNLSDLTGWEIPVGLRNLQDREAQKVHHCNPEEIENYLIQEFSLDT